MEITIIGLGGIGSILCERLCRFVSYAPDFREKKITVNLIDGDSYEMKNKERQEFSKYGNKAKIKEFELKLQFYELLINSFPVYVNEETIPEIIRENSIVFLCVDNHKTRMIVSKYCNTLDNVILISGGNDLTDGNVQVYIRKEGVDITPDLCAYHPEIENPADKLPEEMSCEELSHSEPQLYFTNLGVATIMCWAFYNVVVKGDYQKSEIYFDISSMNCSSKVRIVK